MRPSLEEIHEYHQTKPYESKQMNDAAPEAITNTPEAIQQAVDAKKAAEEAIKQKIQAKYDDTVVVMPANFFFKTQDVVDPVTGKPEMVLNTETNKEEKKTFRRPTVNLFLPLLTIAGLIKILENGDTEEGKKEVSLVLEVLQDAQMQQAREIVNKTPDVNQDNFPLDQISWSFISNLPKAERRGGGISKETWEEFGKDYLDAMPKVLGKSVEVIQRHVQIFLNKFQLVKDRKDVLELMRSNLAMYTQKSPNAESYTECVEFLDKKADQFLKFDPSKYTENL